MSAILQAIGLEEKQVILEDIAGILNNHAKLRKTFTTSGRYNSQDVELILQKIDLSIKTIHLSDSAVENYRPSPRSNGGEGPSIAELESLLAHERARQVPMPVEEIR
jgi:hypothetical protein